MPLVERSFAANQAFQTKTAIVLSSTTLILFAILSALYAEHPTSQLHNSQNDGQQQQQQRRSMGGILGWMIDEQQQITSSERQLNDGSQNWMNSNGNGDGYQNYTAYSCNQLYSVVPTAGTQQCNFARTCNQGMGVWAPFVFCHHGFVSPTFLVALISPVMFLWLVLLFRMLGSTAEDYFSPSLEMFSVKLGLPPRFAGVSLLALGNGASDVSATASAIVNDPTNGYKLSLGALTGAAMFISGVISASIVLVADGVPCRGALVRDITMLLITVLTVWSKLSSGTIGPESVSLFLALYVAFVLLVLAADIYHRAVVVPRLELARQQQDALQEQLDEQQLEQEIAGLGASHQHGVPPAAAPLPQDRLSRIITAISNYDNDRTGWGVESDDLAQDRPIMLHGAHGILHGDGHLPSSTAPRRPPPHDHHRGGDGVVGIESHDETTDYSLLETVSDQICIEPGALVSHASSWSGAFQDCWQEVLNHANVVWEDIMWNGDVHVVSKFLMLLELPFTTLRKLTVPLPCEGYYIRGLVALSMALSPVWFVYYMWDGQETNVVENGGWVYFMSFWLVLTACAALIMRYAPAGEGNMALFISTPIALYGFAIAATWIDIIADALVLLLDFIGIVLYIPGPVVGLTILAWGNSMADLSANMTMARKGLANMAMTACFAGPVFNILVGLGLGFSMLAAKSGEPYMDVSLSPSVLTGFVFLCLLTVATLLVGLWWGSGMIGKDFGYVALTLYITYVISSVVLQYATA